MACRKISSKTRFLKYLIDKELPKNTVRLTFYNEELMSTKKKIFALSNVVDESDGIYIDFLNYIIFMASSAQRNFGLSTLHES